MRTTIRASGNDITIKLQGSLAGPAVQEIAELWNRILRARLHEGVGIDLTSVCLFDREGEELVRKIRESGGHFGCSPCASIGRFI